MLGTTGEANSFGLHERKAILEGLIARGVPAGAMMPGTGCASLTDTVELTLHAKAQGCRGVLLLPPFYYKSASATTGCSPISPRSSSASAAASPSISTTSRSNPRCPSAST